MAETSSSKSNVPVEVSDPNAFENYYRKAAFENYYRKAAFGNEDGLIDYWKYMDFSKGSYLPKLILDKIWVLINRKKSETAVFIGREEFYEALQLTSLAQKSKREGTLVDFANQLSNIIGYDTSVLPMLHKVSPPDNDTILLPSPYVDIDGTLKTFAPRPPRLSSSSEKIRFPLKTISCTRTPFDLFLRIGYDALEHYDFGGKGFDRITICIPAPFPTIMKHIFIPPTPVSLSIESMPSWEDRMRGELMERWEDLPDEIKRLALKELKEEVPWLVLWVGRRRGIINLIGDCCPPLKGI